MSPIYCLRPRYKGGEILHSAQKGEGLWVVDGAVVSGGCFMFLTHMKEFESESKVRAGKDIYWKVKGHCAS